jgi:hypothetical protein
MTSKKPDNPFGLAPIAPLPALNSNDYWLARRPAEMTRHERAIRAEWQTQMLVVEAQKAKTIFAEYLISDIHECAATIFTQTATAIWATKETVQNPELKGYVDAFCHRQIQLAGRHMEHATVFGGENILAEIQRSPRVEPPKPSLWQRLFGNSDAF